MNSILNSILESAHQTFPTHFFAADIVALVIAAIMFVILLINLFDVDIHRWFIGVVLAICVIIGMLLLLKGMLDAEIDAEITANNKRVFKFLGGFCKKKGGHYYQNSIRKKVVE